MHEKPSSEVRLEITPPAGKGAQPTVITGVPETLHQNPEKIHKLLDLLDMPKGTEVRVITLASSSIVR